MKKKIFRKLILVIFILLSSYLLYNQYNNYQKYSSYFAEADKYGIEYDQNNYITLESEITALEEQINIAKEEKRLEEEKQAEEQRKLEEQARIEEEKRLEAEKQAELEEQARIEEEQKQLEEAQSTEVADTDACEPYYVNGILLVNKNHCLPASYAPGGLTTETYDAVNAMIYDASLEGIYLTVVSGYRSYE